jgi:hypothetical protein
MHSAGTSRMMLAEDRYEHPRITVWSAFTVPCGVWQRWQRELRIDLWTVQELI